MNKDALSCLYDLMVALSCGKIVIRESLPEDIAAEYEHFPFLRTVTEKYITMIGQFARSLRSVYLKDIINIHHYMRHANPFAYREIETLISDLNWILERMKIELEYRHPTEGELSLPEMYNPDLLEKHPIEKEVMRLTQAFESGDRGIYTPEGFDFNELKTALTYDKTLETEESLCQQMQIRSVEKAVNKLIKVAFDRARVSGQDFHAAHNELLKMMSDKAVTPQRFVKTMKEFLTAIWDKTTDKAAAISQPAEARKTGRPKSAARDEQLAWALNHMKERKLESARQAAAETIEHGKALVKESWIKFGYPSDDNGIGALATAIRRARKTPKTSR